MRVLLLASLLVGYLAVISPFTAYLGNKPVAEKLGYLPTSSVLKAISADQQQTLAAWIVTKVLFYFGSLVDQTTNRVILPPDYPAIEKNLNTAVELDPYNLDAYYFAQSILVWDAGRIDEVLRMLEQGMKFRSWDWYLPYFAGFDSAYFKRDFPRAAGYYRRAADLSGIDLFARLAGRYLYETSQTEQAIAYLTVMEKNARKDSIRKAFRIRIQAFQEVQKIEAALDKYRTSHGLSAQSIDELLRAGLLVERPVDPYGGTFYLDDHGRVRTTSKFAFAGQS